MQAKSLFILVTSTAVVLLCASAGPAEGPAEPADGGAPQLRSDAGFPDVYLNDSLEAEELIAKARRLADGGQWSAAAELLEQACALYGAVRGPKPVSTGRPSVSPCVSGRPVIVAPYPLRRLGG